MPKSNIDNLRSEYIQALATEDWEKANALEREADAKPYGEAAAAIKHVNAADYLPAPAADLGDQGETDYGGDR